MRKYFYIVCYILFLSNLIKAQIESTQNLNIQTFKGIITKERFWGPPNYGEDTLTDKKEIVPVITLDVVITIPSGSGRNASEKLVKKLQVVTTKSLDGFLNKNVILTGTLFEAQSGHHYTNYLIDLIEIIAGK